MLVSLKHIIQELEDFCNNHKQINEFNFGKVENITTKNHTYPMIWVSPGTHTISGNMITLRFDMLCLDLLENDLTNELDGLNDTLLIINDVVSKFWDNQTTDDWLISTDTEITPVDGNFDDLCIGHVANIEVEVFNSLCDDYIPDYDTAETPTETKYYIASTDDIIGSDMTYKIDSVTDNPTGSEITMATMPPSDDWSHLKNMYIGYATNYNLVLTGYTVTLYNLFDKKIGIDYPTFKSDFYERLASLTEFTTATYTDSITLTVEGPNYSIAPSTDLSATYPTGTIVRITTSTGEIFYDIIDTPGFKSGKFYFSTYLSPHASQGENVTVEIMTNIV